MEPFSVQFSEGCLSVKNYTLENGKNIRRASHSHPVTFGREFDDEEL